MSFVNLFSVSEEFAIGKMSKDKRTHVKQIPHYNLVKQTNLFVHPFCLVPDGKNLAFST